MSHGGLDYKQLLQQGIRPRDVKDFSVSINPSPLPDSVIKAIEEAPLDRYPDSDSTELRQELSGLLNCPLEQLFVTNGTSQAVFLLSQALIDPERGWMQAGPTYSEYRDASMLQSEKHWIIRAREEDRFYPPVKDIIDTLEKQRPSVLWLCSPNNPTGTFLKEEDFHRIRETAIDSKTHLIVDEAYRCFVPENKQYNTFHSGVINLRSMTKDYSIPALRLGYFRASIEVIEKVRPYRPEWSVSLPAQRAGCMAIREQAYFEESWKKTIALTEDFRSMVEKAGYRTFPSLGNFFLIKIHRLEELKPYLWKDLITIRDCTSFGLNDIIRVGTRKSSENKILADRLKAFHQDYPPLQ